MSALATQPSARHRATGRPARTAECSLSSTDFSSLELLDRRVNTERGSRRLLAASNGQRDRLPCQSPHAGYARVEILGSIPQERSVALRLQIIRPVPGE